MRGKVRVVGELIVKYPVAPTVATFASALVAVLSTRTSADAPSSVSFDPMVVMPVVGVRSVPCTTISPPVVVAPMFVKVEPENARKVFPAGIVSFDPASLTSSVQAKRLRPLIRIASEPHTPCAQLRRKVRVPSR